MTSPYKRDATGLRFSPADLAGAPSAADSRSAPRPVPPGVSMTAAVSPPRQPPRPVASRAKPLARLALAGVGGYVAIDILLAFLRPGYSLIYNAESDYGRGPWFWVMDANFLLRCALSLAIAGALSQVLRPDGRARGGLALLVTWAI